MHKSIIIWVDDARLVLVSLQDQMIRLLDDAYSCRQLN